ncbi:MULTISPECIES: MurR/RpiR family transcriptional regulator [unclassified Serratia (in: enterobacteria)]|uniref:MurR/RpiR family transcriptional regulator n=1 Tax=unclassified Serratia (in: enterobacteria) TaxID=2647522 RepID=UPI000468DCC5|nr:MULTISPECIES: MurR/RpiR family transcriptional regulator [unclassified Serratia (in: enterobacteria)]
MDIVYQIEQGLPRLSARDSRLARFILDNLNFVSGATFEELAARAGVSNQLLNQFAQSFGCSDLNEFIGRVRVHQQDKSGAEERVVTPRIMGDVAWLDDSTIEKLAARAGIGHEVLDRFSHSIGRETFGDILFEIRARIHELSQQETRVAQAILADVAFASSATIEQLAVSAGVSPATITRFARSVGCDDIRDLRMKLAQASGANQNPALAEVTDGLPAPWAQRVNTLNQQLITQLGQTPVASLERAATALRQATAIHIFSANAVDAPFANLLQYRLLTLGRPANLCQDPALMSMTASMLDQRQALLVIAGGQPGSALINAVHQARLQGVAVIALAQPETALTRREDIVLPVQDNQHGTLLAIELLCEAVADSM